MTETWGRRFGGNDAKSGSLALWPGILLVQIHEFDDMGDRNRLPIPRDSNATIIGHCLCRYDRAGFTHDDGLWRTHINAGCVRQPNAKWLEGMVIELAMKIVVGHADTLQRVTAFGDAFLGAG